jgi:hypothetical protein
MLRRFLNLAAALSLLLALASAGMWVRSRSVTEGWESVPRPSVIFGGERGWYTQVALESGKGRLVYVKHVTGRSKAPSAAGYGYLGRIAALPPERRERRQLMFRGPPWPIPPKSSLQIPGVVWVANPDKPFMSNREYLAVSWCAIAAPFTILPATCALLWGWRRWHRARPAFPVITPEPAQGSWSE